jgi:hypothetical protein
MNCPIERCVFEVPGPLRICKNHFRLVPRPQQDALAHYAKAHKGGPAHKASFARAVESIEKTLAFHQTLAPEPIVNPASMPYRDD